MRQQFKRRNRSCRSIRRGATDEESRSVISSNLNLRTTLTVASTKTYPYFISTNSLTAICWFSPHQRRTHPPSWIAWCEVSLKSSAVLLRRMHHFWSSMARRSCWLLERHDSEKDELDNQKLSHAHLYPVSKSQYAQSPHSILALRWSSLGVLGVQFWPRPESLDVNSFKARGLGKFDRILWCL